MDWDEDRHVLDVQRFQTDPFAAAGAVGCNFLLSADDGAGVSAMATIC